MSFRNQPLGEFIRDAAARTSTPGGGAASAVCAALGAAMGAMAARFTASRKRFREIAGAVTEIAERLDAARARFLELADADSEAYAAVERAWALPKGTDAEKSARRETIARACLAAMDPPLAIAREGLSALRQVDRLSRRFNENLAADLAVAAHALAAGIAGALVQVEANLGAGGDEALSGRMVPEIEALRGQAEVLRDQIGARVEQIVSP